MNYKLTKQLKDAGFPQIPKERYFLQVQEDSTVIAVDAKSMDGKDYIYIPTLSELIEACGAGFSLERLDMFQKPTFWKSKSIFGSGQGATPEEAVAKLWLELNKK